MASDIFSVVAGALTGIAALGGVYLTNVLKRRDDREARAQEQDLEKVQIRREKGEHLYVSFDSVRARLQGIFDRDFHLLEGTLSPQAYAKGKNDLFGGLGDALHVAKFNIETFFPKTLRDYQSWKVTFANALDLRETLIRRKLNGAPISDEDLNSLKASASQCLNHLERICTQVAEACRD